MSIKRLSPEAIETFSLVLHPKRRYSARSASLTPAASVSSGFNILTENGEFLITEAGEYLQQEN